MIKERSEEIIHLENWRYYYMTLYKKTNNKKYLKKWGHYRNEVLKRRGPGDRFLGESLERHLENQKFMTEVFKNLIKDTKNATEKVTAFGEALESSNDPIIIDMRKVEEEKQIYLNGGNVIVATMAEEHKKLYSIETMVKQYEQRRKTKET